jgi:hypothetical protein
MAGDQLYVSLTAAVILGLVGVQVFRRGFDPFAPLWLFLAGFAQIYVVQAISYRDYSIRVRGEDLVTRANARVLCSLLWFVAVYYSGLGKVIAARLPRPPAHWSPALVVGVSPFLIAWGLVCAGIALHDGPIGEEETLLRQFPILMLIAGVLLIVTGRQPGRPLPALTAIGLFVNFAYTVIWMFNGKRSHALIAVLTAVCAYYTPRLRRPSTPVLAITGFTCALVVTLAIGWRGNHRYEQSSAGFVEYLGDFDPAAILVNLNMKDRHEVEPQSRELASKETEEYCGFLLMLDTVPEKSDYDYGSSYLRVFSTYIPRIVWPDKPLFGREQWVNAWIAGSEFPRDASFTGPAIGILGAAQLNGGAVATAIVLAALALLARTAYDYYRYHALNPWAQAWWALTYYNAWLMTANDDPLVWFYYIYGHTTLPPLAALWLYHKLAAPRVAPEGWGAEGAWSPC